MHYTKEFWILVISFTIALYGCIERNDFTEEMMFVPNGRSSKMQSFCIENDTFRLELDTISQAAQESVITVQVILTVKGLSAAFYSYVYKTHVYNANEIKVPMSQFKLMSEADKEDSLAWNKTDSIIQFLSNPESVTQKYYNANKINYLDVFLSSRNPNFRKEKDTYVQAYFSRFRFAKGRVAFEQDFELFKLDDAESIVEKARRR